MDSEDESLLPGVVLGWSSIRLRFRSSVEVPRPIDFKPPEQKLANLDVEIGDWVSKTVVSGSFQP
jgi:hypothetical protein